MGGRTGLVGLELHWLGNWARWSGGGWMGFSLDGSHTLLLDSMNGRAGPGFGCTATDGRTGPGDGILLA